MVVVVLLLSFSLISEVEVEVEVEVMDQGRLADSCKWSSASCGLRATALT
jgi:hypothetical protein